MNNIKKRISYILVTSVLAFGIQSSHAAIAYQNTTGDLNTFLNSGAYEVGDEIVLTGGSSAITSFTFQYTLNGDAATARIRFYENNGPLSSGYASPQDMFFDSGIFNIASGTHTLLFDTDFGLGLAVPSSHFTWSVQFFGTTGSAGPDLFDPVTVGGNYNDYWDNDGTGWTLRQTTNGMPINFAAEIQAVPEPSTIALGVLGAVVGLGLARRKRS